MKCPICNSAEVSFLIKKAEDLEYKNKGKWGVCFCETCKMGFINPKPKLEEALNNYGPEYIQYHPRKGRIIEKLYEIYIKRKAMQIRSLIGNEGNILEVGCGSGQSMKILSRYGNWNIIYCTFSIVVVYLYYM